MEDALVPLRIGMPRIKFLGLNPCFNGRCTRTRNDKKKFGSKKQKS